MERLAAKGIPLLGYLHWTLTDNYEWGSYDPRFGLWAVDLRSGDLERKATSGVEVYREIVKANGVESGLADTYFR
jgi:beta-glucosidase